MDTRDAGGNGASSHDGPPHSAYAIKVYVTSIVPGMATLRGSFVNFWDAGFVYELAASCDTYSTKWDDWEISQVLLRQMFDASVT